MCEHLAHLPLVPAFILAGEALSIDA